MNAGCMRWGELASVRSDGVEWMLVVRQCCEVKMRVVGCHRPFPWSREQWHGVTVWWVRVNGTVRWWECVHVWVKVGMLMN